MNSKGWLLRVLVLLAIFASGEAYAEEALELKPTHINQVRFESTGEGEYQISTTGNDGYVEFAIPTIENPAEASVLSFEYFSATGVQGIEVRLRSRASGWVGPIDAGSLSVAEGWTKGSLPLVEPGRDFWRSGKTEILRIDFGQVSGAQIRLRSVTLRDYTAEEQALLEGAEERRRVKADLAERIRGYLESAEGTAEIEAVTVQATEVIIKGKVTSADPEMLGKLRLVELGLSEHSLWGQEVDGAMFGGTALEVGAAGRFEVRVGRFVDGRDRLLSRWQVVVAIDDEQRVRPIGRASYATDLRALGDHQLSPVASLRNAKGLGGVSPVFGLDELVELGVQHITLNVVVTDLIDDREIKGAESFEYGGRRWWLRAGRLAHVDQAARFATEHGITVAAIILLPQGSKDVLVHPESTSSGIYAMPNLSVAEGAEKYAAVMHLLAERYSNQQHGRIDHYIMHNEVDFGWIWTNMGEQPLEVFMDHYVRSMRIAYLQARKFNPHAKVFISLTHHWNVENDPRWRTYSPRDLLEHLSRLSQAEGDFGWGVAYHPYPQNLFNPRTWDDKQVADNFDTRLITMKNLQVLERYLRQDRFLAADGSMRDVLLSEQGYHTDGYGEDAQRLQGAALLYTWDRLRGTDFVLAYDYHRWVDAAEEGGLLLGLRTVGSAGKIAGEKKLGWEVYRDIGTEAEAKWRSELESIYRGR